MTGDEAEALLAYWGPRARKTEAAHYQVATEYSRRHDALTLLVVSLAAFTGSGLFATLSTKSARFKTVLAILSVIAALLAGLDRSLRYLERAEKHREAGSAWAAIVNETEELKPQLAAHPPEATRISSLAKLMNDITARSPYIPQRVFDRCGLGDTYMWPDVAPVQEGRSRNRRRRRARDSVADPGADQRES